MCKSFIAVGPLALASSAGILSKPDALSESRALISLSISDSYGDGSLSTSLKLMVCISFLVSFLLKKFFFTFLPTAKEFCLVGEC